MPAAAAAPPPPGTRLRPRTCSRPIWRPGEERRLADPGSFRGPPRSRPARARALTTGDQWVTGAPFPDPADPAARGRERRRQEREEKRRERDEKERRRAEKRAAAEQKAAPPPPPENTPSPKPEEPKVPEPP